MFINRDTDVNKCQKIRVFSTFIHVYNKRRALNSKFSGEELLVIFLTVVQDYCTISMFDVQVTHS
jgi:hypothetical protein